MLTSTNRAFYTSGLEIKRQLKAAGMTVYEQPSFEPNQVKNSTLGQIKREGVRVVIFMAFEEDTHTVASCAKTEKMVSGWARISMEERAPIVPMIGWLYFRPVLPSKSMQDFAEQVSDYTRTSFNMTIRPESVDLTYSAALHDAVMLYAHAATRMLSEGANLDNGHAVTEAMRTTTFQGVGKSILQLDKNGDRIESYEVMNYLVEPNGRLGSVPVGVYGSSLQQYSATGMSVIWPGGGNQVPAHYVDPTPCTYGEFLNSTGRCADCPAGRFQGVSRHDRRLCNDCSPGMFSRGPRTGVCRKCSAQPGRYQPQVGQTHCIACGRGSADLENYGTMEQGSSNFSSCLCSVNYFTHSNKHIACKPCLDLGGAQCRGFDRQTGKLFAPVAKAGWYGLRMHVSKDGGAKLSRYVFHPCKPGRCLEVTVDAHAVDEHSHAHHFSNLSRSENMLSQCAESLEGFLCNKCKPGHFRVLPSSSTCRACFLQNAPRLGKVIALAVIVFLLFAFVPIIREIMKDFPSLYGLL